MKKILITLPIFLLATLQTVNAEEKYNHFPSLKPSDLQTAFCNIQTYNEKMTAITIKENLSAQDMVKVHELTYTLENSVNFFKATLEDVSVNLEKVHRASEKLDQEVIKSSGQKYLETTSLLLNKNNC
ncbi:MAG: hypothetical protein ACJAQS_001572 [Porticoccus sp.]|jgi:hypothetical protein